MAGGLAAPASPVRVGVTDIGALQFGHCVIFPKNQSGNWKSLLQDGHRDFTGMLRSPETCNLRFRL